MQHFLHILIQLKYAYPLGLLPALLIGSCQQLDWMIDGLRHMILHYSVRNVHTAAWTAGAHIVRIGCGNILALTVVDLPGQLIVCQAEGASGTAAAVMLLHFHKIYAGN